jgi:hypothetical protein
VNDPTIRVTVMSEGDSGKGHTHGRFLTRANILWISEGGPGWCVVEMVGGESFKVAGPAQELAKRLVVEGLDPHQGAA